MEEYTQVLAQPEFSSHARIKSKPNAAFQNFNQRLVFDTLNMVPVDGPAVIVA